MAGKKNSLSIDEICTLIIEGETYREIAKKAGVALSTLAEFLAKPEHSARVNEARRIAASTYTELAEDGLKNAKDAFELAKAKELAHHYRWKSSKIAPKEWGDKLEVDQKVSGSIVWQEVRTYDSDKKTD